jgi:hypothetical protein
MQQPIVLDTSASSTPTATGCSGGAAIAGASTTGGAKTIRPHTLTLT